MANKAMADEKSLVKLPNDVSRCTGLGPSGEQCLSRLYCARFRALREGDFAVVSHGLCFDGQNNFIPLPDGFLKARAAIRGQYNALTQQERAEFKQALCRVAAQDEMKRANPPQLEIGE